MAQDEKVKITAVPSVDPEALKLPATFTNRVLLYYSAGNVRMTFGEVGGSSEGPTSTIYYHSAVVIPLADAKQLAQSLISAIAQIEAQTAQRSLPLPEVPPTKNPAE